MLLNRLTCAISALILGGGYSAHAQATTQLTEAGVSREYGYVPMQDGIRLAYVLWRPKKEGRYPTLLNYEAYIAGALPFAAARPFLEAGYAVLGVNVRGIGCSEGRFDWLSPQEGRDGAVIVEWAAAQPWSDGNIGMFGISYGGVTQLLVAAQKPPHLRAITPNIMLASLYRDFAYTGGMIHSASIADWTFNTQPRTARSIAETRIKGGDTDCAAIAAKHRTTGLYDDVLKHPLQDAWWEARSIETLADRVEVPALVMATWQDVGHMPDGGLRVFQLLTSKDKKLVVQNGGSGDAGKEVAGSEWLRWLDRWVKGEKNGIEKEPSAVVRWEQGGQGTAGWTTTYPSWPPPNLQHRTLYLTADGKLRPSRPAASAEQGVRTYVYPLGTELVGDNASFALAPLSVGSLSYQTAPMNEDMAVLGAPILTFHFSSEQTDTDFLVTLKDIDPEGNTLFLQRAYLRASLRAIDSARSTRDYLTHSYRQHDKLVPGKVYEIKLSVGALGHVVRKGHRLALSILAPNQIPSPAMGSVPSGGPSVNKVYHSREYVSTLVLPVVPGEKAQAPAPACGSLPQQPCRRAAPGGGE